MYTIQEASRLTQVPAYILRYWEARDLIVPSYTSRGHRRYSQELIARIIKIKDLIYVKGLTVSGARKAIIDESRKRRKGSELPLELAAQSEASAILEETKNTLRELIQILK